VLVAHTSATTSSEGEVDGRVSSPGQDPVQVLIQVQREAIDVAKAHLESRSTGRSELLNNKTWTKSVSVWHSDKLVSRFISERVGLRLVCWDLSMDF